MSEKTPRLFDVHLHSEGLHDSDLDSLRFFGVERAIIPAHAMLAEPTAKRLLEQFDALVGVQLERLSRADIRGSLCLGIHPRAIPRRGVSEILSALPSYFRGGRVVALGPMGLFEDTEVEREVLTEQLRLAKRLKLPVVVATPSRNREALTRRTLQLLVESAIAPGRVMIDGATGRSLPTIREYGFHAALMLHPDGIGADKGVELVRKLGAERLSLASHAGDGASDIVALARAHSLMAKAGLSQSLITRAVYKNAEGFFGA